MQDESNRATRRGIKTKVKIEEIVVVQRGVSHSSSPCLPSPSPTVPRPTTTRLRMPPSAVLPGLLELHAPDHIFLGELQAASGHLFLLRPPATGGSAFTIALRHCCVSTLGVGRGLLSSFAASELATGGNAITPFGMVCIIGQFSYKTIPPANRKFSSS